MKATLCCIWMAMAAWIPATVEAAPTLGLAWNDCYTGGGLDNKNDACNLDFTFHQLVVSVFPDAPIEGITGVTGVIEVHFDAADVPDFWELWPGGTREGALLIDAFASSPPPGCTEPWSQSGSQVGTVAVALSATRPDIARIVWTVNVPSPVTIDPAGAAEWSLGALRFNRSGSTTVAGCELPACLLFTRITFMRAQEVGGDLVVCGTGPLDRVSWQGGPPGCWWGIVPEEECTAPTPSREDSWGRLKQIYR